VGQRFKELIVLQKQGAALAGGKGILIVGNGIAAGGRQVSAHGGV